MTPRDTGGDRTGPIFVVGCGRSGTTLLRLMLTAHPNIGIPPEGTFMLGLIGRYYRNGGALSESVESFCSEVFRSDRLSEWNLDRDKVLQRLRSVKYKSYANLVDAVYREYLASLDEQKQRWGDKNIDYVLEIPKIFALFPNAKIIHMIRDGRDIAISYRRLPFGPSNVFSTAMFWRRRTLTGRRYGRSAGPKRYCEVKYEDLVSRPEQECRRICRFISEDFSLQMLRHHEYNKAKELVPRHRLAWHGHTLEPVTTSRMGQWKHEMCECDRAIFECLAGSVLQEFGYETHDFKIRPGLGAALVWMGATWFARGMVRRSLDFVREGTAVRTLWRR